MAEHFLLFLFLFMQRFNYLIVTKGVSRKVALIVGSVIPQKESRG